MQEIECDDGSDSDDGEDEESETENDDELFEWDDEKGCYKHEYNRAIVECVAVQDASRHFHA